MAAICDGTPTEEALAKTPEKYREFCTSIDVAGVPRNGETEVALVWDTVSQTARKVVLDSARAYKAALHEVPGTADLIVWDAHEPIVVDWKTGYNVDPEEHRAQLEHYALCVDSILKPAIGVECVIGAIGTDGVIEWHSWLVSPGDLKHARERAQKAVESAHKERNTPTHKAALGRHCGYCPAWRECPAHLAEARHVIANDAPRKSPLELYYGYRAAEQAAEAVKKSLKVLLETQGPQSTEEEILYLDGRGALKTRKK
jgi:predicted RecB family nuclease